MRRALYLAQRGLGSVSTNPMVGSVITHNGKIIGEGFHREFGKSHAEVIAIQSVKQRKLISDSTLYVNLEPCSHHGKTPPCADLIIKKGIKRVVIGTTDTYSEVSGRGVEMLKSAGIDVKVGVLEKECRFLNRRFFTYNEKKRPYIILKWAETADGFLDKLRSLNSNEKPQWITNDESRVLVHRWRTEEDSILIGSNTALLDNPSLNVRFTSGRNPQRIVLDQQGNLPHNLNIFNKTQPTILFTTQPNNYNKLSITVEQISTETSLQEILSRLYSLKIQSIIVEGGLQVLNSFIEQDLWDEMRRFIGVRNFGNGVAAPKIHFTHNEHISVGNCSLYFYFNKQML